MTHGHPIWFLLLWACVVWYATVTIYVSVKGAGDIRQMLGDLKERGEKREDTSDGNSDTNSK